MLRERISRAGLRDALYDKVAIAVVVLVSPAMNGRLSLNHYSNGQHILCQTCIEFSIKWKRKFISARTLDI